MGGRGSNGGRGGNSDSNLMFDTIRKVTLSSKYSDGALPLSKEEEIQLKNTISETQIYRGISVLKQRLTSEQYTQLLNLREGDEVPSFIASNDKNRFTSATTKKSEAKTYARGGNIELVITTVSNKNNTWANLSNISKSSISNKFSEEDLKYFKQSGEVLMKPNAIYTVYSINRRRK